MAAKYRLEALLKMKERHKAQAEQALARAIQQLEEAREHLEELKEEKKDILRRQKEARKKMDQQMSAGGLVGSGCVHVNFLRKLKEDEEEKEQEIEDQKQVVEEATEAVAKARRQYIDAAKALKMMQKHKKIWQDKLRRELARREEKQLDELGQNIHQLRRWRGEKGTFEA